MIEEFAPAKVNLALHVTGRRDDGYHLLDSLVVFVDAGDRLTFTPADQDSLTISGRFAEGLSTDAEAGSDNLVIKARDALRTWAASAGTPAPPVHIHLEKNLPVASGIGGGSADAAAAFRGLDRLWDLGVPHRELLGMGLPIGADVPMCIESRPLVARGIGERMTLIDDFPKLHLLLVNPLVGVSTPAVFRQLTNRDNPGLDPLPDNGAPLEHWLGMLATSRNDLQAAAEQIEPEIAATLEQIRQVDPLLARMSGSGATCFGVYRSQASVERARLRLEAERPGWYLQSAAIYRG
jgi:4-diphosphocytidyl-2-C-methyl-D-erythritol kinase